MLSIPAPPPATSQEKALVGAFSGHCENLVQAPDYGSWGVDEDDDADRPDEGCMVWLVRDADYCTRDPGWGWLGAELSWVGDNRMQRYV